MCGLTGFWEFSSLNAAEKQKSFLKKMTSAITHRGPNSDGIWQDEAHNVNLGHRRLSIIDLTQAGHQPMISQNGQLTLIYNGEIYNHKDLQQELSQDGISFKGHSDTEILLEALAHWGIDKTLSKLIGMFAFALWDRKAKKMILARDRLGIKPLYYGIMQNTLFFGSELKSFKAHNKWSGDLDPKAANLYFKYGFIPAPYSIYQNIFKLKPGHYITYQADQSFSEHCYWDARAKAEYGLKNPLQGSFEENTDQVEALLKDAIERRMVADVPLGCFLSGGIDSSLVASIMQSSSSKPIKTFAIGFDDKDYNEAVHAKKIAQHLGTDHYEHIFKPHEALDLVEDIPAWFDEPFADSSALPTYLVSKIAREQVTVALSGDGGDEFFGGYNRYLFAQKYWEQVKRYPKMLRSLAKMGIQLFSPQFWTLFSKLVPTQKRHQAFGEKLYKFANIIDTTSQWEMYENCLKQWDQGLLNDNSSDLSYQGFEDNPIASLQYFDNALYLPDDILTKVDRTSMRHGLEARVPLIDHRLVELSWQMPVHQKISGNKGKMPLRHILSKHIPNDLFERPKSGFSIPVAEWLRGDLREMAEAHFGHQSTALDFNQGLITQKWEAFLKGRDDYAHALWTLLVFKMWEKSI